jgi:hypothetical protein
MGLFSGHNFYIHVMFLKYALDLSFLVNVDMLCTDLLVTTRLKADFQSSHKAPRSWLRVLAPMSFRFHHTPIS